MNLTSFLAGGLSRAAQQRGKATRRDGSRRRRGTSFLGAIALLATTWCGAAGADEFEVRISDDGPSEAQSTAVTLSEEDVFSTDLSSWGGGGGECDNCWDTCLCDTVCDTGSAFWVRGEYLAWWTKGNQLPALVATSPAGTAQVNAAVLGQPTTTVLFGDQKIDNELRNGFRLAFGGWVDEECTAALEVTYFSVFDDTGTGDFAAQTASPLGGGAGLPILGRPFYNTQIPTEDARLISYPNVVDGAIDIQSSSEMHSAAATIRQLYRQGPKGRIDIIGGYRYFRLRENLDINEHLVSTDPGGFLVQGTTLDYSDRFTAENDFHGGEFGFSAEFWRECWSLELLAKVALGNLHREVNISGLNVITPPGGNAATTDGGLLAMPTNDGRHISNDFAVLPEFGLNFKYDASEHLTLNIGYTLVMLTDVVRTGEQIDRVVNGSQLNGGNLVGARPQSLLANETDFWAQGLNVGVVYAR